MRETKVILCKTNDADVDVNRIDRGLTWNKKNVCKKIVCNNNV